MMFEPSYYVTESILPSDIRLLRSSWDELSLQKDKFSILCSVFYERLFDMIPVIQYFLDCFELNSFLIFIPCSLFLVHCSLFVLLFLFKELEVSFHISSFLLSIHESIFII